MKGAAPKYLAIICILLVAECINSQKRTNEVKAEGSVAIGVKNNGNVGGDGAEVRTTVSQDSEINGSSTVSSIGIDTTTVTNQRTEGADDATPSKVTGNPLHPLDATGNGDVLNDGGSDKHCVCDCNTGHIITEVDTQTETIDIGNPDMTTTSPDAVSNEITKDSTNTVEPSVETVTEADTAPLAPCTAVGDFPNMVNCHAYFTCTSTGPSLERIDKLCPLKSAFNVELGRCTRDISSCDDGVMCSVAGTFEDLNSNASYYWCVPRLLGGFRKYHIDCEAAKVFVPQLGKCFIDINNLQNLPVNYGVDDSDELDDEDIVKAELKQFKTAEKLKLKAQKLKDKLEKKLQKELAKKAAKEAKEQAKAKSNLKIDD